MRFLRTTLLLSLILPCLTASGQERVTRGSVSVVFSARLRTQAEAALKLYLLAAQGVRAATDLPDPAPVTIELAESELAFQRAYERLGGSGPPEYALAVAFTAQNVILVRSPHLTALGPGSLPETLVHETFHLYLGAMLRRVNRRVPLWFNEGIAQWVAQQQTNPQLLNRLQTNAKGATLTPLASLTERFPDDGAAVSLAYAQSLSFVKWLEGRRPGCIKAVLSALAEGRHFEAALEGAAGERLPGLEAAWCKKLAAEHSFLRTFLSQLTLFSVLSLIALAAFVRYLIKRKRLRKKLEEEDQLAGY
jgi:hypothetical protein